MTGLTGQSIPRLVRLHMLLLSLIIIQVCVAGREIYTSTRKQLIEQATNRQETVAVRAGNEITTFYDEVASDLNRIAQANAAFEPLPARDDRTAAGSSAWKVPHLLWDRMGNYASAVFICDPSAPSPSEAIIVLTDNADVPAIQSLVKANLLWLRQVKGSAISPVVESARWANLATIAIGKQRPVLLVAVVPAALVTQRIQNIATNESDALQLAVADESLQVVATSDSNAFVNDLTHSSNADVRELAVSFLDRPNETSVVTDSPSGTYGSGSGHSVLTMHPIPVGSSRWCLVAHSSLSGGEAVLNALFRRAVLWSVFLMISVTLVILSTTIQMIRGRHAAERAQHRLLTQELDEARQIQLRWLPEASSNLPSLEIAAINQPASQISGDFYDWFALPDGRAVVTVGDVTGHGMSAAFLMATTQLLVRNTMSRLADPGKCLEEVNRQLCNQVYSGQFVTMLVLVIDPVHLEIEAASAGHFPPLVFGQNGISRLEMKPDLMLGVKASAVFRTHRLSVPAGARLLLYTDGVVEARGAAGDEFGVEGLRRSAIDRKSADTMIDAIINSVEAFRGNAPLDDDLTLVVVRLKDQTPAERPPQPRLPAPAQLA